MSRKSQITEMRRLRAAGFSVANAQRMSRTQKSNGVVVAVGGAVALMLLGGIVTLSFNLTRSVEAVQQQAQAIAPAAAPQPVIVAATTPQVSPPAEADALGASTLTGLQQARLSQSLAQSDPETATRSAGGVTAGLEALTSQALQPAATPTQPQADCVSQLSDLVRDVALPFEMASASLPGANPDILNTLAQTLSGCADARLMITGHSDSNGPDVANMQISWERADATMSRLIALGVDASQLEAVGFGARRPVTSNTTADAAENRRVDFRVLRREESNG